MSTPKALVMAGGTGGHIMPGLAVAHELQARGWDVKWLGNPTRMEGRLVPKHGIDLLPLHFSGLRGKGFGALFKLPFTLIKACLQAYQAIKQTKPDIVLGMGGYVAFPGALMARLAGIPIVIHEQNAVAGSANKTIARFAKRVLSGFPNVLPTAQMVGNPVRKDLLNLPEPERRYGERADPLKLLVVGGSLGAMALNELVPQAMARLSAEQRPAITHQSGEEHLSILESNYQAVNVNANCVAFIDNMAEQLAETDLLICRAGAMTVAEVAAVGVAALFVPLPHAIDDHQTANAAWLSEAGAGFSQAQKTLSAEQLSEFIRALTRDKLQQVAIKAKKMAYLHATQDIADVCADVIKEKNNET